MSNHTNASKIAQAIWTSLDLLRHDSWIAVWQADGGHALAGATAAMCALLIFSCYLVPRNSFLARLFAMPSAFRVTRLVVGLLLLGMAMQVSLMFAKACRSAVYSMGVRRVSDDILKGNLVDADTTSGRLATTWPWSNQAAFYFEVNRRVHDATLLLKGAEEAIKRANEQGSPTERAVACAQLRGYTYKDRDTRLMAMCEKKVASGSPGGPTSADLSMLPPDERVGNTHQVLAHDRILLEAVNCRFGKEFLRELLRIEAGADYPPPSDPDKSPGAILRQVEKDGKSGEVQWITCQATARETLAAAVYNRGFPRDSLPATVDATDLIMLFRQLSVGGAPRVSNPAVPPGTESSKDGRPLFFAHLASMRLPTTEQEWVKRLREAGIDLGDGQAVHIVKHAPPGDGLWYRIAVGPFADLKGAEKLCNASSRIVSKTCNVMREEQLRQYELR